MIKSFTEIGKMGKWGFRGEISVSVDQRKFVKLTMILLVESPNRYL